MSEPVTVDQLKALCEEFGYPEPGPNTIAAAKEGGLSEGELRKRFVAMKAIEDESPLSSSLRVAPWELEAAYEKARKYPYIGRGECPSCGAKL